MIAPPADDRSGPPLGREARAIFVQDFASLDAPFPAMAREAQHDQDGLLEHGLGAALSECEHLSEVVGPELWPTSLGRSADVVPGPTRQSPGGVLIAFRWEPVGTGGSFPQLDADLELAPLGPELTVVSVRGRYRRPECPPGEPNQDALMHRIAERTVRAFLTGVCLELRDRAISAKG